MNPTLVTQLHETLERYTKPSVGHPPTLPGVPPVTSTTLSSKPKLLAFVLEELPSSFTSKYQVTMISPTPSNLHLKSKTDFDAVLCIEQDFDSLEDYSDLFTVVAKFLGKDSIFVFCNNNSKRLEEEDDEILDELKSVFKIRLVDLDGREGYVCQLKGCIVAAKTIK